MSRRSRMKALAVILVAALASGGLALARSVDLTRPDVLDGPSASRDVAETVWFQGFLADATSGDPITGTHDISAEIFDGSSSVWGPEAHLGVTVTEGWFNIELGSTVSPLPAFDDPPYYLEITVDGEALGPVLKLGSVPSAFRASAVDAELTLPYSGTADSSMDAAFSVTNTGTSNSGYFEASNVASSAAALSARHEGDGPAVLGWAAGSGDAIVGHAEGPGAAGLFEGNVIVNDTLATAGFWMPTDAAEGYVLTCNDEWGASSWQPPSWPALPYDGSIEDTEEVVDEAFRVTLDGGGHLNAAIEGSNISTGSLIHTGLSGVASGIGPGVRQGVVGDATGGQSSNIGVAGSAYDTEGACYGGTFTASGSGSENTGAYVAAIAGAEANYGGRFLAFGGSVVNYAGYFEDDVEVIGFLYKTGGGFRIDHPFDPLDKYLQHSFVESPDMKNVYDGVVVLDGSGEAWVELPDWFEAVNRDFRYQLTCVGAYAPVYVADEISGNRFRIAGGEPGMKVSWLVTGIRHDPAAEHRRIAVEIDKPESERGRYRYPEAYGLPRTRSLEVQPMASLGGSSP